MTDWLRYVYLTCWLGPITGDLTEREEQFIDDFEARWD